MDIARASCMLCAFAPFVIKVYISTVFEFLLKKMCEHKSSNRYYSKIAKEVAKKHYPWKCNRADKNCKGHLLVHHKNRDKSNNTPKNLEVLCAHHHTKEHTKEFGEKGRQVREAKIALEEVFRKARRILYADKVKRYDPPED